MTMVFFLNTLHEGVDPADYERFVREVDYPTARALPSIERYDVIRIEGPLRDKAADFEYLEIVEVSDLERYKEELSTLPGREEFIARLRSFVADATAVHGTLIR